MECNAISITFSQLLIGQLCEYKDNCMVLYNAEVNFWTSIPYWLLTAVLLVAISLYNSVYSHIRIGANKKNLEYSSITVFNYWLFFVETVPLKSILKCSNWAAALIRLGSGFAYLKNVGFISAQNLQMVIASSIVWARFFVFSQWCFLVTSAWHRFSWRERSRDNPDASQ